MTARKLQWSWFSVGALNSACSPSKATNLCLTPVHQPAWQLCPLIPLSLYWGKEQEWKVSERKQEKQALCLADRHRDRYCSLKKRSRYYKEKGGETVSLYTFTLNTESQLWKLADLYRDSSLQKLFYSNTVLWFPITPQSSPIIPLYCPQAQTRGETWATSVMLHMFRESKCSPHAKK